MKKNGKGKGGRPPGIVTRQRKQQVVALAQQGVNQRQIAAQVGMHPVSVCVALRKLREQMSSTTQAEYEVYRRGQLSILELIEAELVEGRVAPDIAREWRAVRADIAQLLGLNAPGRTVVATVASGDPAHMGPYQRFVHETRWVPEAEFDKLWQLCRALAVPPAAGQLLLPSKEEENETD